MTAPLLRKCWSCGKGLKPHNVKSCDPCGKAWVAKKEAERRARDKRMQEVAYAQLREWLDELGPPSQQRFGVGLGVRVDDVEKLVDGDVGSIRG